jgi:SEC-C motif domain protein
VKPALPCPCGSGKTYAACCGPYHANAEAAAPDAERLMRSRYTAYALGLTDYLLATWYASTRPARLDLTEGPPLKWIGLSVKAHRQESDEAATVSFVARYKVNGRAQQLAETSRFVREDGRWYYVDGDVAGSAE